MSTFSKKLIPADLITQAEAARLRGVTRQAISKLVKNGRLKSWDVAGSPLVRKPDVLAIKTQPGRPKSADKKKPVRKTSRRTTSRK